MDKLALLYEYQQADMQLEAYEKQLKNTPTRKQLIKLQNYLKKQQAVLREMENRTLVEQNALMEIDAQYDRMMELLNKNHKDISQYEEMSLDEMDYNVVKALVHEYETTYDNIIKQKKRAIAVQTKAEETAARLKTILTHVSQAQRDFNELRKQHEEELRAGSEELDRLRKAAAAAAAKVDPALLARYNRIKQKRRAVAVQTKAEETAARLKTILTHVSQAQREFNELKKQHEEELRAGSEELDRLRKAAAAAASKVDPALLARYNRIKQNRSMPVTLLNDGRCMGCNMELPSRDLAKLKKSDAIVECENCGRILYLK